MKRRNAVRAGFVTAKRRRSNAGSGMYGRVLRRIMFRGILAMIMVAMVAGVGFAGWQWLVSSEMFRISSVDISGCRHMSRKDVLELVNVSSDDSLLLVDIEEIAERLRSAPWIREADVTRGFPDHIVVSLTEREPVVFVNSGKFYLADAEGEIFLEYSPEKYEFSLPIISGIKMVRDRTRHVWRADETSAQGFRAALDLIRLSSRGIRTLGLNNISQIDVRSDGSLVLYTADRAVPFHFGNGKMKELSVQFARAEKILYHLYSSGRYGEVDRVDVNFMNDMALAHLGGN